MEKIASARLLFLRLSTAMTLSLAWCGLAHETKAQTVEASPSTGSVTVTAQTPAASPTARGVQPASVGDQVDSFAKYLHFPKNPAAGAIDGAAQFYCDVSETGSVETTYAVLGSQPLFNAAVRSALDWGRFTPASVNGKAVAVYLAGTVLFVRQDGKPVIVVSLATHDRERVSKFANYIQPQLIGGLRARLLRAEAGLPPGVFANGTAEVLVSATEQGKVSSVKTTAQDAKDTGLSALLEATLKDCAVTPAYLNGKPAAGAINVVATFGDAKFDAEREYMYAPPEAK